MKRQAGNTTSVLVDGSIELVGEIDQAGIDALAELLIEAAKRSQSEDDQTDKTVDDEQDVL